VTRESICEPTVMCSFQNLCPLPHGPVGCRVRCHLRATNALTGELGGQNRRPRLFFRCDLVQGFQPDQGKSDDRHVYNDFQKILH